MLSTGPVPGVMHTHSHISACATQVQSGRKKARGGDEGRFCWCGVGGMGGMGSCGVGSGGVRVLEGGLFPGPFLLMQFFSLFVGKYPCLPTVYWPAGME